jgi:PilZ domain
MEQRRTRRFQLRLPLSITRSGAERVALTGHTQNISSSGVLFTTEREPGLDGPIEYIITLADAQQKVNLRCVGKIVRAARVEMTSSPEYQVAATLERYEFVRA